MASASKAGAVVAIGGSGAGSGMLVAFSGVVVRPGSGFEVSLEVILKVQTCSNQRLSIKPKSPS